MATSNKSPVDKMNEYKGTAFPSPVIPFLGLSLGLGVPFALVTGNFLTTTSSPDDTATDTLVTVLQPFGFVGLLFASEFLLGAMARSSSVKASPQTAPLTARTGPSVIPC